MQPAFYQQVVAACALQEVCVHIALKHIQLHSTMYMYIHVCILHMYVHVHVLYVWLLKGMYNLILHFSIELRAAGMCLVAGFPSPSCWR